MTNQPSVLGKCKSVSAHLGKFIAIKHLQNHQRCEKTIEAIGATSKHTFQFDHTLLVTQFKSLCSGPIYIYNTVILLQKDRHTKSHPFLAPKTQFTQLPVQSGLYNIKKLERGKLGVEKLCQCLQLKKKSVLGLFCNIFSQYLRFDIF